MLASVVPPSQVGPLLLPAAPRSEASRGTGYRAGQHPVLVDHFGTEHLIKQATAAGVGLVVFVSSIYASRPGYDQDVEPTSLGWKARAEEVVRASGRAATVAARPSV
jgi:nucleoside-diphosphate-sugar epimerase